MKKAWKNIKIYVLLIVITIISLIASIICRSRGNEYLESISSNIFAGMITGCLLAFISAYKNASKTDLYLIKEAYKRVYDLNMDFISDDEYLKYLNDYDSLFESVYSKIARLKYINEYIEKYTNEKLKKYELKKEFLKEINYNVEEKEKEYQGIQDNLQNNIYKTKKDLINLVREYQKEILRMNVKIYEEIREKDAEIYKIDKSFI